MRQLLITLLCGLAIPALAQKPPRTPNQTTTNNMTFVSSSKALGLNVGFIKSALNVGATFDSNRETGAFGGYFFYQTEKKENSAISVYNTMAFGGHVNLNIFNQNEWAFIVRPGVGLAMVKDVPTTTGKSDETLIGPSIRWSFTHKLNGGQEVGFEQLNLWNLFNTNTNTPSQSSYLSFVFRMPI